jgi:hypothetical protein
MSKEPNFEEHPELVGAGGDPVGDTNNFFGLLPGGFIRDIFLSGHNADRLEIKNIERLGGNPSLPIQENIKAMRSRSGFVLHSQTYLTKTMREVFEDIDTALKEVSDLPLEQIEQIVRKGTRQIEDKLGNVLRKVYLLLRQRGYTHDELIV